MTANPDFTGLRPVAVAPRATLAATGKTVRPIPSPPRTPRDGGKNEAQTVFELK